MVHDQHNIVPHGPKFSDNLHKFKKYKKLRHTVHDALTIYNAKYCTHIVSPIVTWLSKDMTPVSYVPDWETSWEISLITYKY